MNPLDRWARDFGYNDFPTFIRTGGTIREAASDIRHRIQALQDALAEIRLLQPLTSMHAPDTYDEHAEPENAHAEGGGQAA
jgi:hypothetical protein